jgi:hypothetical protein
MSIRLLAAIGFPGALEFPPVTPRGKLHSPFQTGRGDPKKKEREDHPVGQWTARVLVPRLDRKEIERSISPREAATENRSE